MVSRCGFQAESWSWSCLKSPKPCLRARVQAGAPCIPGDPPLVTRPGHVSPTAPSPRPSTDCCAACKCQQPSKPIRGAGFAGALRALPGAAPTLLPGPVHAAGGSEPPQGTGSWGRLQQSPTGLRVPRAMGALHPHPPDLAGAWPHRRPLWGGGCRFGARPLRAKSSSVGRALQPAFAQRLQRASACFLVSNARIFFHYFRFLLPFKTMFFLHCVPLTV